MTVEAVVIDLMGSVNTPGTQVTLTWSAASDLTLTYIGNGTLLQPDPGVSGIEIKALAGGRGGGSGNRGATPPTYGLAGAGSDYVDAFYSVSAFLYPVGITIGQGGLGDDSDDGVSGNPGTDTYLGRYIHVYGATYGGEESLPTVVGAISYTTERGGDQTTASPNTTYAGAAGGGGNAIGGVSTNYAAGIASGGGPGGSGGVCSGGSTGGPGGLYGAGGGGGVSLLPVVDPVYYGGGPGANGVLIAIETYTSADYYNIYRQGTLLTTSTSLEFIDTNPIPGTITYEVISVISGFEQSQGAGYVTVDVPEPQPVAVPNLIGMMPEVASTTIENAGLLVGSSGFQVRATGPYFVVVAQGPAAGTIVPVNTYVSYVFAVPPDYGGIAGPPVTPTPNVTAPSGIYGDQWGANGGGAEPIGGGIIGQTGWSDSVKVTISDGQRSEAYIIGTPNQSVSSQMSDTALDGHTPDYTLPTGGSLM